MGDFRAVRKHLRAKGIPDPDVRDVVHLYLHDEIGGVPGLSPAGRGRWEDDRSGISERYRLHYCRALGIPVADFGNRQPEPPHPPGTLPADAALMLADAALLLLAAVQACGIVPDLTDPRRASDLADRVRTVQRELQGHPH